MFGLLAVAVISLAVWLNPASSDHPAEANHAVTLGLDTNVSGNSALALSGSFQACRVINFAEIIEVDLYVQNLSDIVSFETYIKYDTSKLIISKPGANNQGNNSKFMLQQAQPSPPGNNFTNTSEALPDDDNPGIYRVGGYDQVVIPGVEDPDPIGHTHKDGVLVRLEVQGKPGLGGFTQLQITPFPSSTGSNVGSTIVSSTGAIVGDGADQDTFVDNVINGGLVVGGGTCTDSDGDGVPDSNDNCPAVANSNQANFDGDASGDLCDIDDDNDGLVDASEPTGTPCVPSPAHGGQFDPDCDDDNVSDGANDPDSGGPIAAGPDNCLTVANTNQLNSDGDQFGNACDTDDDNDGVLDAPDNCPVNWNPSQSNIDGDSLGDACDDEDDGDGFTDAVEAHVLTNPLDNCANHTTSAPIYSQSWPADLYSPTGQTPDTRDNITIQDLTSYLAPERLINTDPPGPPYNVRWDLEPGPGLFTNTINIQDLTWLITTTPPMFGGVRAFDGPNCTP